MQGAAALRAAKALQAPHSHTKQGIWYGAELCIYTTYFRWTGNLFMSLSWHTDSLRLKSTQWPFFFNFIIIKHP